MTGCFYEKFIYGEVQTARCEQWLTDYKNCLQYKKNQSLAAAEVLIANEKERRRVRLLNANCLSWLLQLTTSGLLRN